MVLASVKARAGYHGGVGTPLAPPGTHTVATLADLERPGDLGPLLREAVRYRIVQSVAPGDASPLEATLARPDVLEATRALGMRFVGAYAFAGLEGWVPREGWVSEDGVVRISARSATASGIAGQMSPYFLSTTFDDGSVVLTWGKSPPPIASDARVESLGGTGDLGRDWATHREAVERHVAGVPGRAPVPVATLDDCIALSAYYDRCLTTDDVAWTLVQVARASRAR